MATLFAAAACICVLNFHAVSYTPYFPDDSFISLRYAKRLIGGEGLTWTDGEQVEGYSNFLWVVLVAAVGSLTPGLIAVARVLGQVSASLAVAAVFWRYRVTRESWGLPAGFGGLALAISGMVAAYAIAGLEQALVAGLLAWALVTTFAALDEAQSEARVDWRRVGPAGLLFALLSLTRPDGVIFVAAAAAGIVLGAPRSQATRRLAVLLPVLPVALRLVDPSPCAKGTAARWALAA